MAEEDNEVIDLNVEDEEGSEVADSRSAGGAEEDDDEEEEPGINENVDAPTPPAVAASEEAELDELRASIHAGEEKGGGGGGGDDEPDFKLEEEDALAEEAVARAAAAAAAAAAEPPTCAQCPCPELEVAGAERPIATMLDLKSGLGMWFDEDGQVLQINPGERGHNDTIRIVSCVRICRV